MRRAVLPQVPNHGESSLANKQLSPCRCSQRLLRETDVSRPPDGSRVLMLASSSSTLRLRFCCSSTDASRRRPRAAFTPASRAEARVRVRRVRILHRHFVVADAFHLDRLGRLFETVLDCGLFHTFDSGERRVYVANLASVTSRGANLYVLCFSDVGPDAGPHPISQEELRAAFKSRSGWSVASISPDRIQTRFDAQGAPAWLAKIERIQSQDWSPVVDPRTRHGFHSLRTAVRIGSGTSGRNSANASTHARSPQPLQKSMPTALALFAIDLTQASRPSRRRLIHA
jgi:hypothetical protein